jgi:hypothetical protein
VRSALRAAPLATALVAVAALVIDPGPFDPIALFLVGLGVICTAIVGVIGIVVVGGRWALRTARISVGMCLVIALIRPIDGWWWLTLIAACLTASSSFLPVITSGVRKLPAATGPPTRAVITPLLLVAAPFALGVSSWDDGGTATLIVGIAAPLAAFSYSRVIPGGLLAVRVIWPALAIGLAPLQPLAPALASALLGLSLVGLAWDSSVKVAFHPPRERGSVYPIPPELAPPEIRDAANTDERGRSRG